jgi:PHD/YefM family antitoxin component YafN of YafNO toxin-antitoxin module
MSTGDHMSTKAATTDEANDQLRELLAFVTAGQAHRVVIEQDGKPLAALISFADLQRFDRLLRHQQRDLEIFQQIGQAFVDASDEEVEREAIKAIEEIRAEAKEKRRQVVSVGQ